MPHLLDFLADRVLLCDGAMGTQVQARNLRIEVSVIQANEVADGVVEFARTRHATQIFMGRSPSAGWKHRLRGSTLHRVVRLARDMEITIVAERRR